LKKTFVIDIDGTICSQNGADYPSASPNSQVINRANQLYYAGHQIIYFTARGSTTGIDWTDLTKTQLESWGVKYHELIMGKPYGDYYVDDKAVLPNHFLEDNLDGDE
jgi:hypothetical protein